MSALIGTVIVVAAKLAFPLLQLGELWKLAIGIPALFGYYFFVFLVHAAVPEVVSIRNDRVQINHGQSNLIVRADEIRWTRIVIFTPDRVRLRIAYSRAGRPKVRTVGVANRVDLDELAKTLPMVPDIRDARERYSDKRAHVALEPIA